MKALSGTTFEAQFKRSTVPLQPLIGETKGEKAQWPTFSARSVLCQASDFAAIKATLDSPGLLKNAWQSQLLPPGILFKKKGGPWLWSMGPMGLNACVGWPSRSAKCREGVLFFPDLKVSSDDLVLECVLDAEQYVVQPLAWRGPLWLEQQRSSKHASVGAPVASTLIAAVSIDTDMPLMKYAAMHAWFDLPLSFLRKVASHWSIQVPDGVDMFHMQKLLMKHFVPDRV